jgi:spore protease
MKSVENSHKTKAKGWANMRKFQQRTDLAVEAKELLRAIKPGDIDGVIYEEAEISGIKYQKLTIKDEIGQKALGKPIGTYFTVETASVLRRESNSFIDTVTAVSALIRRLFRGINTGRCTLVAGLGNRDITPDSIGPRCAESVLVTRHLKERLSGDFSFLNPVAVINPGVLGTSGIESADHIRWVSRKLKPEKIVVIDALASKNLARLCRTIQITDTGVTPGSGVGNSRREINREVMGVPVIAIGIPTVVDIRTLLSEMGDAKLSESTADTNEMIVTPRNIDSEVNSAGRLIAYALNLALHDGLSVEDIDMLIG